MRKNRVRVHQLLAAATASLAEAGIENSPLEAELLLRHCLGVSRSRLFLLHDQPIDQDRELHFRELLRRRCRREPLQYITGSCEFWSLEFFVSPAVLIPRPETECLVEAVLDFLKNENGPEAPRFLDLGTGSGAIAMALARSCPTARVVALDRSCAALALADRNRRRHHLEDRVDLVAGDWLAPFSDTRARFDVVVSNPPYIPSDQIDGLQPEIVRYEQRTALDGGPDGLDCLALIIGAAPALLSPGGAVFLEIGHDQFAAVQRLARENGAYRDVACRPDYSGMDRVACLVRH